MDKKKTITKKAAKKEYEHKVLISAIAYFLIGIIWYFVDEEAKKNSFIKFHVQQGLTLLIFAVIYSIILGIILTVLSMIFLFIPVLGIVIIGILQLLYLIPLILAIIGLVNALNEKEKELPIIGKFASKLKI